MTDVNADINININTMSALANLRKLETEINSFQRTIASSNASAAANQAALNRALLDGINNTGLFSAKQVTSISSMKRFSEALDKGKLSLGEYSRFTASQLPGMSRIFRREFDTMEKVATSRVKAMNAQYLALGKTVDGVTKAIQSTPTGLNRGYGTDVAMAAQKQMMFNKLIDDGSTKLLNWGKNTQWAGRQLMVGLTLPLAAMGAAAAKAFMEIDKASVALRRVYGDLSTSTAELENNVENVKRLGAEYTKYGIAVSETIAIGARAAATGATNEKLMAATEQTLRFATLGQVDYNQALDTTIAMQTAFGISNEDLASSIDYLNAVENQTILTIEDMSLAIPRVATVIKGLGGDVRDLAVFMTAMREGGVSAENAANGLKSGLASMINPSKQASEYLGNLGINLTGIVDAYSGDLVGTVQKFGQELDKLSDMDRQRALEKTFGKYQYARMSALFSNMAKGSGQAARAMDIATMSAEELGQISEKELGRISESTSVKFMAAMEQLKLAIAPIGEAFLKLATPVIELVTKLADVFNSLPDPIKNAMGIATAAIAGLGPILLMGIGLMGNLVANIAKGIQWWRKLGARIKGDASAFTYMASAEQEAMVATEALEGSTQSLTGKLNLQAGAVAALTAEYERFAGAAGLASGAMGNVGGGRRSGRGAPPRGNRGPLPMANGGTVPGSGSGDKIPALLEPGETVITKEASQKYGNVLAAMNAGVLPGYDEGLDLPGAKRPKKTGGKQLPSRLDAAHLTDAFDQGSEQWIYAMNQISPALRDFATKFPQMVRVVSQLTATLPSTLNQALQRGADLQEFDNGWNAGGEEKLFGAAAMGGADLNDVGVKSALKDMERAIRAEAVRLAKQTQKAEIAAGNRDATAKVTDGMLRDATMTVVAEYEKLDDSARAAATALRKSATTVGQVRVQPTTDQLRQLHAQGQLSMSGRSMMYTGGQSRGVEPLEIARDSRSTPFNFGYVQGDQSTGLAGKSYPASNVSLNGGLATAKKTKGLIRARASKNVRDAGRSDIGEPLLEGFDTAIGRKSPAEEFAEGADDAAKGVLVGAKRSKKLAYEAGRLLGLSARDAYKAEMSQLRADMRNVGIMEAGGMTDATQQTRTLERISRSKERPALVAAGRAGKAQRQEEAKRKNAEAQARREEVKRQKEQQRLQDEAEEKAAAKREKRENRKKAVRRGVNRGAGVMGMASMIPFMAQNDEGKFMGMDANMLGMGMMGASMAAPMIGPAMSGLATGATALAGAMGVGVAAVAAPVAALAAVAAGAWLLKKGMDNTIQAGRDYADAMTTSAKEQQSIADLFGTQTYAGKRKEKSVQKLTGLSSKQQKEGKEFAGTDQGKAMVEDAKILLEKNSNGFVTNMATQLSQMVLSGAVNPEQAKVIASGISDELGRADLTAPITAKINQILAPNGDDVTNSPVQIQSTIKSNLEIDEAALEKKAKDLTSVAEKSILAGNPLLSGDWDAATEASVGYYNTVIANSVSMRSSYLDQRNALKDQITELKNQIKEEENKAKKIELQNELLKIQNQLRGLDTGQKENVAERKQKEMSALRGNDPAQHSARLAIEEAGVIDTGALMHQMAMARERVNGQMTTDERKEFELSFMVDLQSGRIDPAALQTLQISNERLTGQAESIVDTVVNLQATGDYETANQILSLTAQMPDEVLTVFNAKIEGMEKEQLVAYAEVMAMIPADVSTKIAIDLSGMSVEDLKAFKENIESLQGLGIDTGDLIDKAGVDAITKAGEGLKSMEEQLSSKKIQKGFKEINKINIKDTKTRAKKVIEITTEIQDAEGNPITTDQAQAAVKQLLDKTGMTEEKLYSLPADVSTKVITAQVNAESYIQQALNARRAAQVAKVAEDPVEQEKQTKLAEMYYGISQAYAGAAAAGATSGGATMGLGGGGSTPKIKPAGDNAGGGGGAKKDNALTEMNKGFIDQIKMYSNMDASIKMLNGKREDFVKNLNKGQGIISQLRKLGLSEGIISNLASQGYDALKSAYTKYSKNKGGVVNQNALALQANLNTTIGEKVSARIVAKDQVAASKKLQGKGLTGDQITGLVENPEIAKGIANLGKKGGMTAKELENLIKKTKNLDNTLRQAARAADPLSAALDDISKATEIATTAIDTQNAILEMNSDKSFISANKMTKQQAEIEISLNNQKISGYQKLIDAKQEANDLDQHEIELLDRSKKQWQDKIDLLQVQSDGYQKSIDLYQRENELRDQQSSVISHSLDILSKKESEINDAYDTRIKALDEVASINQHILDQQQSQLNISQALSSGDIYAAAQAQQQMQSQSVQYSMDQMRAGLDTAKENAISGLTTDTGLTRAQAEQRIADLKEQNYQNDLLITGLQNQIYTTTQAMVPYKDQIANIDKNIATYNETIWQRNNDIYNIQKDSIAPLTKINSSIQEKLDKSALELQIAQANSKFLGLTQQQWDAIGKVSSGVLSVIQNQTTLTQDTIAAVNTLADAWDNVGKTAAAATKAGTGGSYDVGVNQSKNISYNPKAKGVDWASISKNLGFDLNKAMADLGIDPSLITDLFDKNVAQKKYKGGMIRKYASGSFVAGSGGMDSVHAALTPGEFVVRKTMVEKYGPAMFDSINQGSFSLPKYDMGSAKDVGMSRSAPSAKINAPVYNTYSINVPVTHPGASADEIANKVMMKIKNVDNSSIRRINGY
jgi:TP901 family phage tail tape measure protein